MAFLGGAVESCCQQPPFPGMRVRLPCKGEGWEAPGSGKAEATREGVMMG